MNSKIKKALLIVGVPTAYAIALRFLFGVDSWQEIFSVMSVTFLFLMPIAIGVLTIYFSADEDAERTGYKIVTPWIPIMGLFLITLLASLEGWACWMMILPVFLIMSSIGGFIGGYLKKRKSRNHLNISLLILMPILLSPLESLIDSIPATFQADTYIDINAPAEKIWDNVTKVREINQKDDTGWLTDFLGFPRPVKAELDFEGVGAYRKAIFTNGLIFHETVTEYEDNKKMVFDIVAKPHEIPSTTLDEHVVIGGNYFDVLNGTYELEDLGNGKHRLHLSSKFEMKTTFNFYAGLWGKWIMKDIQNNILKIEKARAENE